MAEYIERSKIFEVWRSIPAPASVTSLSAAIHQTPAADVTPVVRCKDCKWDKPDKMLNKHWCTRFLGETEVIYDDFCSYGRKRAVVKKDGDE